MIYVIYGDQYPLLKKQVKKLKEDIVGKNPDAITYVSYSGREELIQNIISDANKPSLFSDKRLIMVTNPYFLTNSKEKVDIEKLQDYEVLKKYIISPSESADLVFVLEGKNFNNKSEIVKLLNKHAKFIEAKSPTHEEFTLIARQYFTKHAVSITQDALNELLFRCQDDIAKFVNEAKKLVLYAKNIVIEDVYALVPFKIEQNAFAIAESLIKGNITRALKIYYDLRLLKEESVRLIALMASQFRILTRVSFLLKEGGSQDSIAKEMGIHPYRVKLAVDNLKYLKYNEALKALDNLYNLDYRIKSGQVDPYYGFELYLLNFNKGIYN